jgi:hypothetical protein
MISNSTTIEYKSKEIKSLYQKDACILIYCSTIHNSQNMEFTQMPFGG